MKSLSTFVTTVFETYRYIASISGRLHFMFLMLSIAEAIIGGNEASLFSKGFSLFLLRVLSFSSRSNKMISPSGAILCHYLMCLIVLRQLCFPPF